ncbi:Rid family detoxifying hydrolase [Natrarchaeobaculum aegyptiacum]|uniref:Reactive intermediate/imine deaminase n=1 Tax=Natrarchaeobaculum aegyptiacum TaxID=745377 RepID=A0A2Z2I0R5_9EURY|nr:Rid family detoxifying hydrolase [Natrarchaeobaculum aegyptiacum]ARS91194.1 reactive intermediate/imine deaminase [Natrarchaeobaculum aegyptiacum]
MKRLISTDDAPEAVGAYSQATTDDSLLFTAGQLPLSTDGDLLVDESVAAQTRQCIENLEAILAAEVLELSDLLTVTIYLDDIDDFDEMYETSAEFVDDEPPARSAIEVGAVPKGGTLEIETVATLD